MRVLFYTHTIAQSRAMRNHSFKLMGAPVEENRIHSLLHPFLLGAGFEMEFVAVGPEDDGRGHNLGD